MWRQMVDLETLTADSVIGCRASEKAFIVRLVSERTAISNACYLVDYSGYINCSLSAKQTSVSAIATTRRRQRTNNTKCDGYSKRNSRISNISNQFETFRVGVFGVTIRWCDYSDDTLIADWIWTWIKINESAILIVWFLRRGSAELQNLKGWIRQGNHLYLFMLLAKCSSWFQAAISKGFGQVEKNKKIREKLGSGWVGQALIQICFFGEISSFLCCFLL